MGAEGMVTKAANWRSPGTTYKRSKNAFAVTSIALTLVLLGTKLLELPVQSLIGSLGTFVHVAHARYVIEPCKNLMTDDCKRGINLKKRHSQNQTIEIEKTKKVARTRAIPAL